jgi:hypothetical protein
MTGLNEWLSLFVGLMGVLSSGVIAYLAYSLNRQAQRAQTAKEISDSYAALMHFRAEHPHVLKSARHWRETCFKAIYNQTTKEDEQRVLYYTYAEFCISFCNAVLYARKSRLLD